MMSYLFLGVWGEAWQVRANVGVRWAHVHWTLGWPHRLPRLRPDLCLGLHYASQHRGRFRLCLLFTKLKNCFCKRKQIKRQIRLTFSARANSNLHSEKILCNFKQIFSFTDYGPFWWSQETFYSHSSVIRLKKWHSQIIHPRFKF